MTDREYVESKWDEVHPANMFIFLGPYTDGNAYSSWLAAAEFTRTREKQIAEVREEIDLLRMVRVAFESAVKACPKDATWMNDLDKYQRILARMEAVLAELQRGMKP